MNIRELRIGNLIIQEGFDYDSGGNKIGDPEGDEVITVNSAVVFDIENDSTGYKGVSLTEEWLLKFGFKDRGNREGPGKRIGNFQIFHSFEAPFEYWHELSSNNNKIKYVHQLQNLYFALTGEELNIKENGHI